MVLKPLKSQSVEVFYAEVVDKGISLCSREHTLSTGKQMAGLTIVEKVLARASSLLSVAPGEVVTAKVDLAAANDITAPPAFRLFLEAGGSRVFDPEKIAVVAGRHAPFRDAETAERVGWLSRFCGDQGIERIFTNGEGMDHVLLPESGIIEPGMLVANGDSHAATIGALGAIGIPFGSTEMSYVFAFGETWFRVPDTILVEYVGVPMRGTVSKDMVLALAKQIGTDGANGAALEFAGEAVAAMSISERFTLPNMAIELGAMTGVIGTDKKTRSYLERNGCSSVAGINADGDAMYARSIRIDTSELEPQIAIPDSPDSVVAVSQTGDVALTQINIGSCTNGRSADLRQAAEILKGRRVAPGVRLHVTPATKKIYTQALREGVIQDLNEAGAIINPPGCGACAGWHMGALGPDDVCLATHNRNFKGRMGHRDAQIYLCSPYVAAASALTGRITDPREFL
ncbi:MAG: aconitase/3-isopropylmalate dehydratase large subunit family protein [Alphaproteobacteria bacterium]